MKFWNGEPIIWEDRIIGRFSDFNGDGKEELYMYSLSGMNARSYILGFDKTEFVELVDDLGVVNASISNVDPDKKTIDLQIVTLVKDPSDPRTLFEERTYKWDNAVDRYELINTTTETKRYSWNWDTE